MDWKNFENIKIELWAHTDKTTNEKISSIKGSETIEDGTKNKITREEWNKIKNGEAGFNLFNSRLGDFHLQPADENIVNEYSKKIENKLKSVREELMKEASEKEWKVDRMHRGRVKEYYRLYDFVSITIESVEYEMMGFRMALDCKNNIVQCRLMDLQFGIKRNKQSYYMYPDSLSDGVDSSKNSKLEYYYNPHIDFYAEPEKIAKEFIKFIEKNQAKLKNELTLYIAHKSIAATSTLLRLNRITSELEVYKKVKEQEQNDVLHNAYSIRDDFDSTEDYAMYAFQNSYPCIFGGEHTPTPIGTFQISKVSERREEYISGYHPKYDRVKFFGYLVIFEDYFIHSNMYLPETAIENFESKEAISRSDEHTSGCIRVAQEVVDWLVDNIEVGTTMIM